MYRFCMSDNSWEMHSMINNGTGGTKVVSFLFKMRKVIDISKAG